MQIPTKEEVTDLLKARVVNRWKPKLETKMLFKKRKPHEFCKIS